MGAEEKKGVYPPTYYGTFQGNPSFPQPSAPPQQQQFPNQGYAVPVQGYPCVPGYSQVRETRWISPKLYIAPGRLPCCGIGLGWLLFVLGFFAAIPWLVGAFLFFFFAHDARDHAGLAACTIAAIIAFLVGGTKVCELW